MLYDLIISYSFTISNALRFNNKLHFIPVLCKYIPIVFTLRTGISTGIIPTRVYQPSLYFSMFIISLE